MNETPLPVEFDSPGSRAGRLLESHLAFPLLTVGVVLSGIGCFFDAGRFGFAWLLGGAFAWSIALGCLFWVVMHHLTRAVWSVAIRRIPEMAAAALPWIALLFLPLIWLAPLIYEWMDARVVAREPILEGKQPYLNPTFFYVRSALFFLIWVIFALIYVRQSVRQDCQPGNPAPTATLRRLSPVFMILFALTLTFASFDWLMSLEPRWFSTIFGVYVFSGVAVSSLAFITLMTLWLRNRGALDKQLIDADRLYSLGALMFAFTCFWGYIAISQYLLIWYANLHEETFWYADRAKSGWLAVSLGVAVLRFFIPFLALLSRGAKMSPATLAVVSALILLGQAVDLHWLIMPESPPVEGAAVGPAWHWQELGPLMLFGGALLFAFGRNLQRWLPSPVGDPYFAQSSRFHL